jgi:hypothetical protein
MTCATGVWSSCAGETGPTTEQCNGLDDDCDGYTDNVTGVLKSQTLAQTCDTACASWNSTHTNLCVPGTGSCRDGKSTCLAGSTPGSPDWGACTNEIGPTAEICNNLDDDCDSYTDNAAGTPASDTLTRSADPLCAAWVGSGRNTCLSNTGQCRNALQTCMSGAWATTIREVGPSTDICNGLDDDCDGYTDNAFGTFTSNTLTQLCPPADAPGQCRLTTGLQTCTFGLWQGSCVQTGPSAETCNNLDDDCDGYTDNVSGVLMNNTLTQTEEQLCLAWNGPGLNTCQPNVGQCSAGVLTCVSGAWDNTTAETGPSAEICNNLDDDCDGYTDNAVGLQTSFTLTQATCDSLCTSWNVSPATHPADPVVCQPGVGQCQDGVQTCIGGTWGAACAGEVGPGQDYCNGVDDDCDGATDDGWGTTVAQSTPSCADWQASQVTPADPKALVGSMCPVISGCRLGYLGSRNGTCNVQQFGVNTAAASAICTGASAGCQVTSGISPAPNGENGGGCKPGYYDFDSEQGTIAGGFCNGCEGYDMTSALIGSAALGENGAGPDLFSGTAWCPASGGFLIASNMVNGANWGGTFSTGLNSTGWQTAPAGGFLMTNNGATSTVAVFGTILSGYGYGNALASPNGPDGTYMAGGATSALYNATGTQFGGHNYFALRVAASDWNPMAGSCGSAPNATITGSIQSISESGNTVQITTSSTAGLQTGQSIIIWGTVSGYNSGPCNNVSNITATTFTCTLPSAAGLAASSSGQFAGILNNGGSTCASNGGMGNYGTGTTAQYYFGNLHIQLISPTTAPPLCPGYGTPQYRMNVYSSACIAQTSWTPTSGVASVSPQGTTGAPLGGITAFDLGDIPNGASGGFPPSMTAPTSFLNANRTRQSSLPISAFDPDGTISVYIDVFRVDGNPDCSAAIGDAQPYAPGVTYGVNDLVTSGGITFLCTASVKTASNNVGPTGCGTSVGVSTCTDGVGNTWQYNGKENSESSAGHDTSATPTGLTSEYKLLIQQSAALPPVSGATVMEESTRRGVQHNAVASSGFHAVSGFVSGLVPGSRTVLQLNGTHDIEMTSNGAFSFPSVLFEGEAWAVTIGAEPVAPSQTCRIDGGVGVAGAGDIANVRVTCATNAFPVGGNVEGLVEDEVTLKLNGAHPLVVSSNGPFTFGDGVAVQSGAPYSVTVAKQPGAPAQTCTVSDATGVVGGTRVTGVTVSCTKNTYAVGGKITGLAGSGATLLLNEAQELVLAPGSTAFRFANPVASGELFNVRVKTQPVSPTQFCTATGGSGAIGSTDVSDVAVTCTTLSFPVGGHVSGVVGNGLTIRLNGEHDLRLVPGATSFDFGKSLVPSGNSYAVTVVEQPASPSQICTIIHGAGSMGGEDITDVRIECARKPVALSGLVSGLSGEGAVLRLNGGHDLALRPGISSFRFGPEAGLVSGGSYELTFAKQPDGPAQTCLIFNGAGTMGAEDVGSVVISCRTKGAPPPKPQPLTQVFPRSSRPAPAGTIALPEVPVNPTWTHDVKSIVDAKCGSCHDAEGVAGVDLSDYAKVRAAEALLLPSIQSRAMPPWMPADDTPDILDARSLTETQRATLVTWIQNGMPLGDPAGAAPETSQLDDFPADTILAPEHPFIPRKPPGQDENHCFILDPHLPADAAITGLQVVPGARRVVHHVRLFVADPEQIPFIREQAAKEDGASFDCSRDFHVGHLRSVGGWVPGSATSTLPEGTGEIVKAGSMYVMQIHYSLLGLADPTAPPADRTAIRLQYKPVGEVLPAQFTAAAEPDFHIAAGAVQNVDYSFDPSALGAAPGSPLMVYGMEPHMHLHGTGIQVSVRHPDGSAELLMDVPQWRFDWQELYYYRDPFTLAVGDEVNVSCRIDNTAANQPYFDGVQQKPRDISMGESSEDEMCIAILYASLAPPRATQAAPQLTPLDDSLSSAVDSVGAAPVPGRSSVPSIGVESLMGDAASLTCIEAPAAQSESPAEACSEDSAGR